MWRRRQTVQTPGNSDGASDRAGGIEVGSATQQVKIVVENPADQVAILHVSGEIDLLTANVLGERIREQLIPANNTLVLDLSDVDFLGSAGLAEIVSASQAGTDGGIRLVLVATNRAVLRPLEATGLLSLLTVYETVDEAITSGN
jgi:anti-sigma B factor antagonist